ncbi:hypothetical protein B566_EDAN002796 [Ephemera danica]|nr:hypothetical protein B566_EDAN002796 [Ephemera danica]
MEDLKDKSIHFNAQTLSEEIKLLPMYKRFYNDVQKLVASPSVQKSTFRPSLLAAMKQSGLETELRNTVFHWMRSHQSHAARNAASPLHTKEPIAYLRKAQLQWEKRIHKSLTSMCAELGQVLSRCRLASDKDDLGEKWNELSTYDVDLSQYRPVYAPKDFLDVLLWIRSPNYRSLDGDGSWDFSQIPLKVKSLNELKSMYQEAARGEPLLGVNPNMPSPAHGYGNLEAERIALGEKVIAGNNAPVAQEYLKKGCPRSIRNKIWAKVLGSEVNEQDVQLTASNDDQYFVFEDILYQVMLCFTRDAEILSIFHQSSASPVTALLKGRATAIENTVVFPPSGIIPFHGFTMYATPFCYMYDEPIPRSQR